MTRFLAFSFGILALLVQIVPTMGFVGGFFKAAGGGADEFTQAATRGAGNTRPTGGVAAARPAERDAIAKQYGFDADIQHLRAQNAKKRARLRRQAAADQARADEKAARMRNRRKQKDLDDSLGRFERRSRDKAREFQGKFERKPKSPWERAQKDFGKAWKNANREWSKAWKQFNRRRRLGDITHY